jgi:hypothetical protein
MASFNVGTENFISLSFKPRLGRKEVLDAQVGLLILSEEVDVSTYLYVQDVAIYAEDRLKELVPKGDTGNLHASIKRYLQPVRAGRTPTGQFTGEGPWISKVYFDDRAVGPFYRPRTQAPGATRKTQTDRPIEYVLSLNDGRRGLHPSAYGKKRFAWYNPKMKTLTSKKGKMLSPYGYNNFFDKLRPRQGLHFIEQSNALTSAYAEERTRSFLSKKGRTTVASREALRSDLGFMIRGDF